jgi:hypothetical protein
MSGIDGKIAEIISEKDDIHDIDIRELAEEIGRQIVKILIESGIITPN